jgi:Protein of unknown function (DUF3467)
MTEPEAVNEAQAEELKLATELPHIRGEGFQVFYSNFGQCGRSAWDIAVSFGRLGEGKPGEPAVIDLCHVVMTPPFAKALLGVINAQVKQYEAENGEVQIPGVLRRAVEAAKAQAKADVAAGIKTKAQAEAEAEAIESGIVTPVE